MMCISAVIFCIVYVCAQRKLCCSRHFCAFNVLPAEVEFKCMEVDVLL